MKHKEHQKYSANPITWMASNPVAANLLMFLFLAGGIFVFTQTTQEVFPAFDRDTISVSVSYPGASPEEIEKSIILALEDAINEIDGIGDIASTASEGAARLSIEVLDSDERMRITQDIKSAVDRISSFPDDAEDPIVQADSRRREVVGLVLYGDASEATLLEAAETIRDQFSQNKDIGPVELAGTKDREIHIEISQHDLRRLNLTLSEVSEQIKRVAVEIPGGTLDTASGDVLLRLTERRDRSTDFANIPIIVSSTGATVQLGDFASVTSGFEDTNAMALFNGKPSVSIEVYRVGDQTPITVSRAVKKELETLNNNLPGNLSLAIVRDRSEHFEQRAELLLKNGAFGLILVIFLLSLFLDIRVALWVSMGIPISFAGAFLLFPLTSFSINIISMFAFIISLGIVVDDAIIVGENIYSYRQKGLSPMEAAIKGTQEIGWPIFFSVLTNMIAFIPLYFVPGIMGKIFNIIPIVVICVFGISLIECLFILPTHLKLNNKIKERNGGLIAHLIRFQRGFNRRFEYFVETHYKGFLGRIIHHRYSVLTISIALLILAYSYVFSGRMGMESFPRIESDYAYASVTLPLGSPDQKVNNVLNQLISAGERVSDKYPDNALITGISSNVRDNSIETRLYLSPAGERPVSTTETTRLWRKEVGELVGIETSSFLANRGGPGSGASLTVELSHRDNDTLILASQTLAKTLEEFPNTSDVNDGTADGKRQFDFRVNDYGYALGLTARDIASQIRTSIYGLESFKQQDGINEVTVRLRLPENERQSEYDLANLIITTGSGLEVLLDDVVTINAGRAYTSIIRRNGRRSIQVQADVSPPSQTNQVIAAITENALPQLQQRFPGLNYSFEGRQAEIRDSIESLIYGLIGVLLLIFALIAILFRSYAQPLMVMVAIPFSVIGAVFGHLIMGYPLSLMSLFGLMALTGVVVNDSIVLIEFANRSRESHHDLVESLLMASVRRFRPIILTTMTTFVGLAPMIFETSRQARFLIPMALSLGFGILFTTLITLILIPALYLIIEDIKNLFLSQKD